MRDILTACTTTDAATVQAFLVGQGQTYVTTYGPFTQPVLALEIWQSTVVVPGGYINDPAPKVVIHTTT